MRLLFILFTVVAFDSFGQAPVYKITTTEDKKLSVKASFPLVNDTIFIFARGTTKNLPEGEAGFVQDLKVKDAKGTNVVTTYAGDGNWILQSVQPGQEVSVSYALLTTHKNYNWDHVGGSDEAAFTNDDGLFFTGYTLFIVPDLDTKNIRVDFIMPAGWKASTPWKKIQENSFMVENGRQLVNNCFMLGRHNESVISESGMEMRLAISQGLSYGKPLVEKTMRSILPAYRQLFGGIPAPVYLVAMSKERMTDGSAFRRSFSQIFKDSIDEKGMITWGYIMAHEIFHLWNGHAIIPAGQEEWFKEGFTDYMVNVMLRREGMLSDEFVYRKLEHMIRRYWLDRWWQKDTLSIRETGEHKEQLRYGVYGGGAVVAIALEGEMRKATGNKKGIYDLMQAMFLRFGKTGRHYSIEDISQLVKELTGKDMRNFFDRFVSGRELIDPAPYLNMMGLDLLTFAEETYVNPQKNTDPTRNPMYRSIYLK